jgi:hypothetical protein
MAAQATFQLFSIDVQENGSSAASRIPANGQTSANTSNQVIGLLGRRSPLGTIEYRMHN